MLYALTALVAPLLATSMLTQPEIRWWTIEGGGVSSGGGLLLRGVIGQPDAGDVLAGGQFEVSGGFLASFAPARSPCGTADFNGDGDMGTDLDIEAFFACLAGDCCETCFSADFNGDGDVGTDADIEAYFRVLSGGSC